MATIIVKLFDFETETASENLKFTISISLDNKYTKKHSGDGFPITSYKDNLYINTQSYIIGITQYIKSDHELIKTNNYMLPNEYFKFICDLETAYGSRTLYVYDPRQRMYNKLSNKDAYFVSYYKDFKLTCYLKSNADGSPWGITLTSEVDTVVGYNRTNWTIKVDYRQLYVNLLIMKSIDIKTLISNALILNSIYGTVTKGISTEETKIEYVDSSFPIKELGNKTPKENPFNSNNIKKEESILDVFENDPFKEFNKKKEFD